MNPYEVLGVDKSADPSAIKRAYRKRAQRTHPDRAGGDKEAFAAAASAYALLSDPQRRLHYDRTGEEKIKLTEQQLLNELAGLMLTTIDQVPNVEHHDIVAYARGAVELQLKELEKQQQRNLAHIEKRERAVKRLRSKRPNDILLVMLTAQIATERQHHEQLKDRLDGLGRMLEILDQYSYAVNAASGAFIRFGSATTSTSTAL